eukprot:s1636_g1.t1
MDPQDESAKRLEARPVAEVLLSQLQRRNLSLLKILDPDMHGKMSFAALKAACQRYELGLQDSDLRDCETDMPKLIAFFWGKGHIPEEDFHRLSAALAPDSRQLFGAEKLRRLLQLAQEGQAKMASEKVTPTLTSAVQGHGQANGVMDSPNYGYLNGKMMINHETFASDWDA